MPTPVVTAGGTGDLPLTVVTTNDLFLTFAPTRGGRLLSLRVRGTELLWQNPALVDSSLHPVFPVDEWPDGAGGMSTWANLGGTKTWPAPQGWGGAGEWAGPPDQVLDSGAWTEDVVSSSESVTVTLTSPDDRRSGIRIIRSYAIPCMGTHFEQTTTFTNISAAPVRWSIWEVCQVNTAAGAGLPVREAAVVVPVFPRSGLLDLGTWVGDVVGAEGDSAVRLPIGTGVAKRGFIGVPGSVGYEGPGGESLSLTLVPVEGADYPDGGAQVEVWLQMPTAKPIAELENLHPSAHLVELEVLGPLVNLEPGESTSTVVTWVASGRAE
ncbi:MAG: hypothetical protein JWM49_2013 [Microbacteriaceae bacterium]|nr:hypothetical protein [Microbacteriaceae bacterium]